MAEKVDFGGTTGATIIRTPKIQVLVKRWDWDSGNAKDSEPVDITPLVVQYQYQKTIKTPSSGCTVTAISQIGKKHLLDFLNPMDVIYIREFDTLKFNGFIRSIQSTGSIDKSSGKPSRAVSIKALSFGNLYLEGQIGLNLYLRLQRQDIAAKMTAFADTLTDAVKDPNATFAGVIDTVITEWYSYLEDLGASKYVDYLDQHLDYQTGLTGKKKPGFPREMRLFRVEDEQMTLWSIMNKIIEPPFNEMWFDNGPRSVFHENNETVTGRPGTTDLTDDKTYLIVRATPFNGTVINGSAPGTFFDGVSARVIPKGYLTKFALNKTMDEMFSFYLVQPSAVSLKNLELVALGIEEFDQAAFDKYLYKPMVKQQFYSRDFAEDSTEEDSDAGSILTVAEDGAKTLKNWFDKNDQFLSGSFTINVPSNPDHDPKIGEKIEFEGLEGNYFYVEGISHRWSYGGPLTSDLSVTRGYGIQKPIELVDKIFRRGLFAMNAQFNEP